MLDWERGNVQVPETSKCPYCSYELRTPKRKKKCPNCGNYMYVRTKHSLPLNRVVFTKQEVKFVDFWTTQVCNISFVDNPNEILTRVYEGNLVEAMFKALEILKDRKVWMLTIEGKKIGKAPAFEAVSMLQHQLNMLLYSQTHEKAYKDAAFRIRQESIRNRVLEMKKIGIKKVCVHVVGDRLTCPRCAEQEEKVYDIDTFLREMPIPHPQCSNEMFGCRCRVVAYFPLL